MSKQPLFLPLAFALLIFSLRADAETFKPKMSTPESYADIQFGIQEARDNINSVQCGGFADGSTGEVNGQTVTGDIPIPDLGHDLPGRTNINPLGAPTNGVGTRGQYEFPNTAFGYLSACDVVTGFVHDGDLAKLNKDVKWDITNSDDPNTVSVSFHLEDGNGKIDVNPDAWCKRYDKATPHWCKRLYEVLKNDLGPYLHSLPIAPDLLCPYIQKQYCTDFTDECRGQACRTKNDPDFWNKLTECHLDGNGDLVIDDFGGEQQDTSSFYRHYAGDFMVPGVTVEGPKNSNVNKWQIRGECYEYYQEIDPKDTVTTGAGDGGSKDNDEQCELVISTPNEAVVTKTSPEWKPENGRAQKEKFEGPNAGGKKDPPRPVRPAPDPWVTDTETNLSIIDVQKLQNLQQGFDDPADITGVVGALIPAKQKASKTVTDYARTDAFDDSDHRALGEYWEAQEKILTQMVRAPTTRLLLPARFLVGLDDKNPLFQYVRGTVTQPNGIVEVTLRAGPEDLGHVLQMLKETYVLPINQVRIPIIVPQAIKNAKDPFASEERIDALILAWQQWMELENKDAAATIPPRASFAGDAVPLITILKDYKLKISQARKLQNGLSKELVRLYGPLREFEEKIATWYKDNTEALRIAAEHSKGRAQLKRIWRHIQHSMLQTDACQLQWCSNMRYSIAVYSLLDSWWGDTPKGQAAKRNQQYVPSGDLRSVAFIEPKDQVFDFSSLVLPREHFSIPVLDIIEAPVELPLPPLVGSKPQIPTDFPFLPNLPDAAVFDNFTMPTVHIPTLAKVQSPPDFNTDEAKKVLREFRVMIDGTSVETQISQEVYEDTSLGGVAEDEDPDFPLDRNSMRGAYCRFIPSITIRPDDNETVPGQDAHGDPKKIIHVEGDLRERAARLFSRWMPEQREDLAGRALRLKREFSSSVVSPKCKEDIVCAFLFGEKTVTVSHQLFPPSLVQNFAAFATSLQALSLPAAEQQNPYLRAPKSLLERAFPALKLPISIDLRP